MNQPVLQLEDFGITDLEVHWFDSHLSDEESAASLNLGYTVGKAGGEGHRYRIALRVADERKSKNGETQLKVRVEAVGFFAFPDSTPVEHHPRLIRTVGLPILYSTTRGALQMVSGVLPPGSRYLLPTVNVLDLIRSTEGTTLAGEGAAGDASIADSASQGAPKTTRRAARGRNAK